VVLKHVSRSKSKTHTAKRITNSDLLSFDHIAVNETILPSSQSEEPK